MTRATPTTRPILASLGMTRVSRERWRPGSADPGGSIRASNYRTRRRHRWSAGDRFRRGGLTISPRSRPVAKVRYHRHQPRQLDLGRRAGPAVYSRFAAGTEPRHPATVARKDSAHARLPV